MSANVDTMFYTNRDANGRDVPWHGLGTPVPDALTSSDAIKKAGLDWTVESNPIYDNRGIQIPGYVANTRSTDSSVLGIVSDRYKIVQNSEAFDFTDHLIENSSIRYETAGSLKKGKQIWLLAQMPTTKILDDDVSPYICFTNTHDGTGSVKVCMTPVRVVCNNTLNLALSRARRTWSTRHIGDINAKLQEARETLNLANTYLEELNQTAQVLADTKVTDSQVEQILDSIFPVDPDKDSARKIANVNEAKDTYYVCYMMPDIAKFKGTAWGAINAMADMVDHTKPQRMTSTYAENNWGKIIVGHPLLDAMMSRLVASKAA